MNPVFIKRFLKYNKPLVAVIGVSLLVVLFLLVIAVLKYLEMVAANSEVNRMRDIIAELQDPRKNKVAVIEGNLDLLKKDYVIYQKKNEELRPHIGHPYEKALDAMAKELGMKNGEDLTVKFYEFVNKRNEHGNNEQISIIFRRFEQQFKPHIWRKAVEAFMNEANSKTADKKETKRKISFEEVTSANVNDIFLQSLGIPREMSGRGIQHCKDIMEKIKFELNKHVISKNIEVNKDAVDFSLTTPGLTSPAQIAESMQNMEIVSDMISRIVNDIPSASKGSSLKSFESIRYNGKSPLPDDNKAEVYKYNLQMIGTMTALRQLFKSLNDAIYDGRLYIVRNVKLNVPLESDGAAVVVGFAEEPAEYVDGKKVEIKYKDDSDLAVHLRRNYGKVLIGANPFFNIELDVEYVILKQHEFQSR